MVGKLERSIFDKMVNGAFLGKREVGRPIKYNIKGKGRQGWIELLFNPRNKVEMQVSNFMRFAHPYLAFVTYRFHVEKAREIGIRIEDFYMHKFHKEPYIMNHIYAQYFHPTTVLERVRDVSFYRRPRTLFKGFKVPDWATAEKRHGWEVDAYSRQAWDNAMHDFNSEWTPMQFWGERQEPNVIEWFRLEQFGKGSSSRLFYNEVPHPTWLRHNGHLDNPEEVLYSFTGGDQDQQVVFGMDTSTEEGRALFRKEYEALHEMAPELIKMEDFQYPHEMGKWINQEPYFQRLWQYYRDHTLKAKIANAVETGKITAEDSATAVKFLGGKKNLTVAQFVMAKNGLRPDLASDESFLTTDKVMTAVGMNKIPYDTTTAEPYEVQFWGNFDGQFNLTEIQMRDELPYFITDPSNRMKVQAIMDGIADALEAEETKQLAA